MHRKGIQSKGKEKGQGLPIIQVCGRIGGWCAMALCGAEVTWCCVVDVGIGIHMGIAIVK